MVGAASLNRPCARAGTRAADCYAAPVGGMGPATSAGGNGKMQIKIEIDVRPDELRRFLGLPDIAGLQDDLVAFLRDKIGTASEFDAAAFVRHNVDTLRKTPAWKKLVTRVRIAEVADEIAEAAMSTPPQPEATPKKRKSGAARTARKVTPVHKPRKRAV